MAKPFSPRELVARVKAILRRASPETPKGKNLLSHDNLEIDLEKRRVSLHGRPLALTPHEYKLLHALMSAPGKVFTRPELLDHLYPGGEG